MEIERKYELVDKNGDVRIFPSMSKLLRYRKEHPDLFLTSSLSEEKTDTFDDVERPSHYADRKYEVWDVMMDTMTRERFKGYLEGATLKYLMRWDKKENPLRDLRKAKAYLNKLIETIEEEEQHAMVSN